MAKLDLYRSLSDSELTAAVKAGDDKAFDAVFLRYFPQVKRFLASLVKDQQQAEDLAQSVFMKLWLFRARLEPSASLKNYLFVLARNGALDVFRAKRILLKDVPMSEADRAGDDSAAFQAEYAEANRRIRQVVEAMPDKRRQVFTMSRYQSLPNEAIADRLGLSVRTVEKHIQVALQDIRKKLN